MNGFFVGANYPWIHCGHDFGPGPPAWYDGWTSRPPRFEGLVADLERLRRLGLRVVRWWILADGVNYPVGAAPETLGRVIDAPPPAQSSWRTSLARGLRRRAGAPPQLLDPHAAYDPPALSGAFLDDYRTLLRACESAGVQLLPSLLSFEFFLPRVRTKGSVLQGGRERLVFGGKDDPTRASRFLDAVLDPLLAASRDYARSIYAWEMLNEPDWVVVGGPLELDLAQPGWVRFEQRIAPGELSAWLLDGVQRIAHAGFLATIGFAHPEAPWLDAPTWTALRALAAQGRYLHQRHHYPMRLRARTLPPHDASPILPCLLGEVPTAIGGTPDNRCWGDAPLRDTERHPDRYLRARIELARELGYPGVLLWAERAVDPRTRLHRLPLRAFELPEPTEQR